MATVGTLTVQLTLTSAEFEEGMKRAQALTQQGTNVIVRTVDGASRSVQSATRNMGEGFVRVAATARSVVTPLTQELGPALSRTAEGFSAAVSAARGFGLAGGAMVAGAVVAVNALRQYISALTEAAEKQALLNLAVRGMDAGAVRASMEQATAELVKGSAKWEALTEGISLKRMWAKMQDDAKRFGSEGFGAALERAKKDLRELVTGSEAAQKQLSAAQEALQKVAPSERARDAAQLLQEQAKGHQAILQVEIQRAQTQGDLEALVQLHERMTRALAEEYQAAARLINLQLEKATAAAAVRGESPDAAVRESLIAGEKLVASFQARTKAAEAAKEASLAAARAPEQVRLVAEAETEIKARLDFAAAQQRTEEESIVNAQRLLQIQVESAEVAQMGAQSARALLDAQLAGIDARRRAALADPTLRTDPLADARRQAIEYRAEVERTKAVEDDRLVTAQRLLEIQLESLQVTRDAATTTEFQKKQLEGQIIEVRRRIALADPNLRTDPLADVRRDAAEYRAEVERRSLAEGEWRDVARDAIGEVRGGLVSLTQASDDFGLSVLRMADRIATSLLDTVLKKALQPVEEELGNFLARLAGAGLGFLFPTPSAPATYTVPSGVEMQTGGIVTRPTRALIGEAGPEAIVPLDQYRGGRGGDAGMMVVINDNRGAQAPDVQVREMMIDQRQAIEITIDEVVKAGVTGGRYDSAFGRTYGMTRRGARG
jgi:hypothetical protein